MRALYGFGVALLIVSTPAAAAATVCSKGAVYKSLSTGHSVVVKRFGLGESRFTPGGPPQAGMALDILAPDGTRGALFGPMRSYMFVVDPKDLMGYSWDSAEEDPGGFYRVMADDGQSELFTLSYVGCAS